MRAREIAIKEILERLRDNKTSLGLERLEYDPLAPVRADMLNAVHIHCTDDKTIKSTNRLQHGFPTVQAATVLFECWLAPKIDHVEFYEAFLRVMLTVKFSSRTTSIRITRKIGPFDGGVEGAKCLQIIMELQYIDEGIANHNP